MLLVPALLCLSWPHYAPTAAQPLPPLPPPFYRHCWLC